MSPHPIIRLEIDHMRYSIIAGFNTYIDELKVNVDQAVASAIERFDFEKEVGRIADGLLRKVVENALHSAFNELRWDKAMHEALVKHMMASLEKSRREDD